MVKCSQMNRVLKYFLKVAQGCPRGSVKVNSLFPNHWPVYEECMEGSSIYSVHSQTKKVIADAIIWQLYQLSTECSVTHIQYSFNTLLQALHEIYWGTARYCGEIRHLKPPPTLLPWQDKWALPGVCQFTQSPLRMKKNKTKQWPTPITMNSTHSHFQQLVLQYHGRESTFSSMGTLFSPCIRV